MTWTMTKEQLCDAFAVMEPLCDQQLPRQHKAGKLCMMRNKA